MIGVIVVDAESFRSTCRRRDAYIHDHARYSHNYALFYQLLEINLFTHRNTYAILREATSETYGPGVYLLSYKLSIYFYLQSLLSVYIIKIPKIFILLLSSLSDLTLASGHEGIDNPLLRWLRGSYLFV